MILTASKWAIRYQPRAVAQSQYCCDYMYTVPRWYGLVNILTWGDSLSRDSDLFLLQDQRGYDSSTPDMIHVYLISYGLLLGSEARPTDPLQFPYTCTSVS